MSTSLKESGNYHYKSNNYQKAKQYYIQSLQQNPNDSAVHHNLSMTYFQLEKYDEAYKHCSMALEIDPKYVKALFRRIKICIKQGKLLQAVVDGQRYQELQKNQSSEIIKEVEDVKAKLRQGTLTPPPVVMFASKRQPVPQFIDQTSKHIASGPMDLESLRNALRRVQDISSNSYSSEGLQKIEALKRQLYSCLLQVEDDTNKIEILDILIASVSNKQKESYLWRKVKIAKDNKWEDIALSALHQLRYYSTKQKEVSEQIASILVPQVDDKEQKEPIEAPPVSEILTASTIVSEDKDNDAVVDEVLRDQLKKKLKKLAKHREFQDFVWILQSLKDSKSKQLRNMIMLEMSNLNCIEFLMSGSSQQQKNMVKQLISDLSQQVKRKFKV